MSSIGPPTGMRDWLPQDALLRQHLMETIGTVYRLYGYLPIDTPVMEDLSVLLGKGGGENEKLLFKILKRGEKLTEAQAAGGDLADQGLRFDLTVPLARFVATHQGKLPKVFRRYHIAPVWRADRPQKGRFREFYQCDIDVVGGASPDYEVEIITATERVLKELNLGKYRFRLSDKRLLPLVLEGYGVPKEQIPPITIVLDKLDKLSLDEICAEIRALLPASLAASEKVEAFVRAADPIRKVSSGPAPYPFDKVLQDLAHTPVYAHLENAWNNVMVINDSVHRLNGQSGVVPDPILVRGMDYYTGPVYEAVVEGYPSSILGGGRYDGLIGRFAGKDIPAVGCSIGFERILAILQERKSGQAAITVSRILLVNDGPPSDGHLQRRAERLRNEGLCVETHLDLDDVGKQFKQAEASGIKWAIKSFDDSTLTVTVRHLPERRDLTMPLAEFVALLNGKTPS